MKKTIVFSAIAVLSGFSSMAGAQEFGRVISSTPVIQQVAVPRQVCSNQPVAVQQPNTGAGGVIGGLAGGAIGNQFGHGDGRAAATILGVVGGALLGNRIESNNNAPQVQNLQQCTTQTAYENRTIGYNVQYEYAGKQYTVQLPYDPGPTIRLQVTPVGGLAPGAETFAPQAAAPMEGEIQGQPSGVVVAPPVAPWAGQPVARVVAAPVAAYPSYPAYPAYPAYYAPYYPPIGISLGFGYVRHSRHWH